MIGQTVLTDAHKIWTLVCIDKLYEEDTFTSAGNQQKIV